MILTAKKPTDWKMLQDYVAKYFNEAGYLATTPKNIKLSRGDAEIDVYVKSNDELNTIILCECKYWNSSIPQEKIHAFRTIVADSGANLGLFITTSNFQSGSINAALYSNIKLLTWDDFLELIKEKWVINKFMYLSNLAKPLTVYTDPLDVDIKRLSRDKQQTYLAETPKHIKIMLMFNSYYIDFNLINGNFNYSTLSIHLKKSIDTLTKKGKTFTSIEDFFEYSENRINNSLLFYQELFGDYIFELNKLL